MNRFIDFEFVVVLPFPSASFCRDGGLQERAKMLIEKRTKEAKDHWSKRTLA